MLHCIERLGPLRRNNGLRQGGEEIAGAQCHSKGKQAEALGSLYLIDMLRKQVRVGRGDDGERNAEAGGGLGELRKREGTFVASNLWVCAERKETSERGAGMKLLEERTYDERALMDRRDRFESKGPAIAEVGRQKEWGHARPDFRSPNAQRPGRHRNQTPALKYAHLVWRKIGFAFPISVEGGGCGLEANCIGSVAAGGGRMASSSLLCFNGIHSSYDWDAKNNSSGEGKKGTGL